MRALHQFGPPGSTAATAAEAIRPAPTADRVVDRVERIATAQRRGLLVLRQFTRVSRDTDGISTGMATALAVSKPNWWTRLRREWTKNDGKPWEQRASGRDLKETVLVVALVVLLVTQIGIVIWTGLH